MAKLNELEIDVEKQIYKLNGENIGVGVTKLSVNIEAGEIPKVTIFTDANVKLQGMLLSESIKPLYCDECHKKLGDFIGEYEVACPNCGSLNYGYLGTT